MRAGFICSNYYSFFAFKKILEHEYVNPVFVVGLDERRFRDSGMQDYYYQGSRFFSYAIGLGIESFLVENLNKEPGIIARLKEKKAEYIFAMGWPDILTKDSLSIPKIGCIGIHPSFLPEYRGGAPINWQYLDRCKEIGVTSFFFSEKIDSGNIIVQKKYPLPKGKNVSNFIEDVYIRATWEIFSETIEKLKKNDFGAPMDLSKGFYRKRRKPEDGRINFNGTPEELVNFIISQCFPFPGAFIEISGEKFFVNDAEIVSSGTQKRIGDVLDFDENSIDITCSEGIIRLKGIVPQNMGNNIVNCLKPRTNLK